MQKSCWRPGHFLGGKGTHDNNTSIKRLQVSRRKKLASHTESRDGSKKLHFYTGSGSAVKRRVGGGVKLFAREILGKKREGGGESEGEGEKQIRTRRKRGRRGAGGFRSRKNPTKGGTRSCQESSIRLGMS